VLDRLFIMSFPLAPIIIRYFINAHIGIGNGELPLVKWLQKNEKKAIYSIWAFYLIFLNDVGRGAALLKTFLKFDIDAGILLKCINSYIPFFNQMEGPASR